MAKRAGKTGFKKGICIYCGKKQRITGLDADGQRVYACVNPRCLHCSLNKIVDEVTDTEVVQDGTETV